MSQILPTAYRQGERRRAAAAAEGWGGRRNLCRKKFL